MGFASADGGFEGFAGDESGFEGYGQDATNCFSTTDCASGFDCIGNKCIQNNGEAGAGTCDPSVSDQTSCATTGVADCDTPSCDASGTEDASQDCCGGDKSYLQNESGDVQGTCKDGDPEKKCSVWCTEQYAATGSIRAGCRRDTNGNGNICSECADCNQGDCVAKSTDDPDYRCYCDNGKSCEECTKCDFEDKESETFGQCIELPDNEAETSGCLWCEEADEPTCDCGVKLEGRFFKACEVKGADYSNPAMALASMIKDACEGNRDEEGVCPECKVESPKAVCTTSTIYAPAAEYPATPSFNCPANSTCRVSGKIYVQGAAEYATIFEACPNEEFPEGCLCEKVECNCHNDCGDCMICSPTTGTCIPDPRCPSPPPEQELPPVP